MTHDELQSWFKGAKYYDTINAERPYDEDGIGYNTRIYLKDGKYYAIDYYDDHAIPTCNNQNIFLDPREVRLKSRQVVEYYFENVETEDEEGETYRPLRPSVETTQSLD